MMFGGASCPPRRYMLPGVETEAWSRPKCSAVPSMKEERNERNMTFFLWFVEGLSRLRPSLSSSEKLMCLPLPFMPRKGFSWKSRRSSCSRAILRIVSMTSWFWSQARFASVNCGANSNWHLAFSLWRVARSTPRRARSRCTSSM